MADNWSASVLTLADPGDWCEWTMTVPDATARDNLNGDNGGINNSCVVRGALTAASRSADLVLIVNDVVVKYLASSSPPDAVVSSPGWVSDNRFKHLIGYGTVQGFGTVSYPSGSGFSSKVIWSDGAGLPGGPFVVGTNTIRLLSFGRTSDGASEAIEIDVVAIQTGSISFGGPYSMGTKTDSVLDATPGTFAAHTNPDAIGSEDYAWLLKAPDAATGTVGASAIEILKFCEVNDNIIARIRVTGAGSPLAGNVGYFPDLARDVTVLDGAGEATFSIPVAQAAGVFEFWYGGSDTFGPTNLDPDTAMRVNCSGWHVGRIGVGVAS